MAHLRLSAATIAVAMMLGVVAVAKDEWKTVTLHGEPGLTISIPTAVADYSGGKDPDDLMFFSVVAGSNGSLVCIANRNDYPKEAPQAAFAAAIATERREVFCNEEGATISGFDIGGSESFVHNGSQAAICTASYTDSAEKSSGRIRSQMVVAAPNKAYFLTCTIEDEDQEMAEYGWAYFWEQKVRHMQMSFRLPN